MAQSLSSFFTRVCYVVPIFVFVGLLPLIPLLASSDICCADDKSDLLEAIHAYFQSEKDRNVNKVWELLAPSSEFKKAYSYPFYQEMIRRNPFHLRHYKIDGILEIRDNDDKTGLPNVEKIALVQVTVTLSAEGSTDLTQVRVFTFLKEGGQWFKG